MSGQPRLPVWSAVLTAREREVLLMAARGLTNPGIGQEMYLSESTVKTHLKDVALKLGTTSRTAAVAKALGTGIITWGEVSKERSE